MPRRTPGPAGRRLTKSQAVALLRDFETDPIGALGTALAALLELADATWPELVAASPLPPTRRAALLSGDQGALDELATELNELRALALS